MVNVATLRLPSEQCVRRRGGCWNALPAVGARAIIDEEDARAS